jgi:hypothetical protein
MALLGVPGYVIGLIGKNFSPNKSIKDICGKALIVKNPDQRSVLLLALRKESRFQSECLIDGVAVGIPVTRHPPHRSQACGTTALGSCLR